MPDGEYDPNEIVEFEVRQRIRTTRQRFDGFFETVREVAIEPIPTEIISPEGEMTLFEMPDRPPDPSVVLFDELHIFYKHRFRDDTTSTLPNKLVARIVRGIPTEALVPDGKGGFKGARLDAVEHLAEEAGTEGAAIPGRRTKTGRLFAEFLDDRAKKYEA